jgi:hypothetical protein
MARNLSRRAAAQIASGVALSGLSGVTSARAEAQRVIPNTIDLWTPEDKVTALVKQQGRTDEGRVFWRFQGIIYAFNAPETPVPLLRFSGCEQQWWEPQDDGSFVRYSSLLTYFRDLDSGKLIRSFTNPITGKKVELKENWSRLPEGTEISQRGLVNRVLDEAFPDFYKDRSIDDIDMRLIDGTVAFHQKTIWPKALMRKPYNQDNTFYVSFADVADPEKPWIPTHGAGHILMPSMANIGMTDPSQGQVLWHVEYYKVRGLEHFQPDYLEAARQDYGDYFEVNPKYDTAPSKLGARLEKLGLMKKAN